MHTKLASFIASSRHNATTARMPHGNGFAAQFWVVALFDGSVKSIHVYVNDFSKGLLRHRTIVSEKLSLGVLYRCHCLDENVSFLNRGRSL
jgi:hypothetical protein